MKLPISLCRVACAVAMLLVPENARAQAYESALGAMVGASYAPTRVEDINANSVRAGGGFATLLYTDLTLIETVSIMPAATIYNLHVGTIDGQLPVTDLDIFLKFNIPLTALRLSFGVPVGTSHIHNTYHLHVGAFAKVGLRLVSNIEVQALMVYKRIFEVPRQPPIDTVQGFAGLAVFL